MFHLSRTADQGRQQQQLDQTMQESGVPGIRRMQQ